MGEGVNVLVIYALPELLLKLSKSKKVRIGVIYCHNLFESNKDVLMNLTSSYKTPSAKDYKDVMESILSGCLA